MKSIPFKLPLMIYYHLYHCRWNPGHSKLSSTSSQHNAFLQGQLTEEVIMSQPQGLVNSQFPFHVCRLKKPFMDLNRHHGLCILHYMIIYKKWDLLCQSDTSLFILKNLVVTVYVLVYFLMLSYSSFSSQLGI